MKMFKNKKTGKIVRCDEHKDLDLIKSLEKDRDYKELMNL